MGIKNFNKILKEYAPKSLVENDIKKYKGKTFAIDTSLILYQYITALRRNGKDMEDDSGNSTSHIFAILQNAVYFIDKGIIPVYVFDGKPPDLKQNTLDKRKKSKEIANEMKKNAKSKEDEIKQFQRSLFITKKQYEEVKNILEIIGIPYIQSEGEADCVCSYLVKNNLVYAAYSEDMDFLTFGCNKLIKKNKGSKIIELNLNSILKELNMNYEEFINLCILLGSDYAPTIKGIGYKTAIKIIHENKSIKTFLKNNKKFIIPNNYEYDKIIKYYKNPCINNLNINLERKNLNSVELKIILTKYKFSEIMINKYLKKFN